MDQYDGDNPVPPIVDGVRMEIPARVYRTGVDFDYLHGVFQRGEVLYAIGADTHTKRTGIQFTGIKAAGDILMRGGSAHDVQLATLSYQHQGESHQALVVVKRHVKPVKAGMEYYHTRYAHALGFPTLDLIGFIVCRRPSGTLETGVTGEGNEGYLFTHYNPFLRSLDTFAWQHIGEESRHALLKNIALLLASMHRDQFFHNDPQLKNICIDTSLPDPLQEPFFIDMENCSTNAVFLTPQGNDLLVKGMRVLINSLFSFRHLLDPALVLPGSHISHERKAFEEYFGQKIIAPYLEAVGQQCSRQVTHGVQQVLGHAFETGEIWKKSRKETH